MNIKEVAKKARVSTATVSRTVNGNPLVSSKTAEKVWRAIRELGYYPNSHARILVSGRSRILGLIISDIANPFFPELVKGFEDTAITRNYNVMIANTGYDSSRMTIGVRRMIEHQVDGVAIMTSEVDRKLVHELSKRGVPIVFLDVGSVKKRVSNIKVDYADGIREAIDHLYKLGHRCVGFISGPPQLKSARVRRMAFLESLAAKRMSTDKSLVVTGNHRVDGGQSCMEQLLRVEPRPTAVLASNDLTAIGALRAIHAAGLQVPRDISLVGFDDIELSQYTDPPLTTVRLSREELGRTAFQALINVIEGVSDHGSELAVNTRLVLRESTGPCPTHRTTCRKRSAVQRT